MHPVGTIRQLARYPVKSMCGERLDTATLTLQGVAEDRRYAFVQTASRSCLPLAYGPRAAGTPALPAHPGGWRSGGNGGDSCHSQRGEVAGGERGTSPGNRGTHRPRPFPSPRLSRLVRYRSHFPHYRQTVARIAEESGTEENPRRFRPNLLVDLQEGGPFEEMNWVGRILRIGDAARVAIIKVDQRCMMITLDPDRATISPSVLRCVAQQHDKCAGVYGVVITAGETRVGDTVLLES